MNERQPLCQPIDFFFLVVYIVSLRRVRGEKKKKALTY